MCSAGKEEGSLGSPNKDSHTHTHTHTHTPMPSPHTWLCLPPVPRRHPNRLSFLTWVFSSASGFWPFPHSLTCRLPLCCIIDGLPLPPGSSGLSVVPGFLGPAGPFHGWFPGSESGQRAEAKLAIAVRPPGGFHVALSSRTGKPQSLCLEPP